MRYISFFLAVLFFGLAIDTVSAVGGPTMCTMQYAPVCGSVEVQCIRAPCYPVRETFGNSCMAGVAGATNITPGECDATPSIPPGGDWDMYGCKPSTGYTWNPLVKKCLRPWESRVRVLTIAPDMIPCASGVMNTQCLQIRTGLGRWSALYGGIEGFEYIAGYTYRLRVIETRIANPPADGASTRYKLLKVISERIAPVKYDENLIWDWYMIGYNDISIGAIVGIQSADLSLTLTRDRYSARICNQLNGSYRANAGNIETSYAMSTKMACPDGLLSKMEAAWNLEGATYRIASARQMAGATGPSIWLTITTKSGEVFTYTR